MLYKAGGLPVGREFCGSERVSCGFLHNYGSRVMVFDTTLIGRWMFELCFRTVEAEGNIRTLFPWSGVKSQWVISCEKKHLQNCVPLQQIFLPPITNVEAG